MPINVIPYLFFLCQTSPRNMLVVYLSLLSRQMDSVLHFQGTPIEQAQTFNFIFI